MIQQKYILHSFDCLNTATAARLHDMACVKGVRLK